MLGRHRKALAQLGKLFRNGAIDKTYWAVVEGAPDADEGVIDLPLGRLDAKIGWWMKHDPQGQPAVTKWKVMGRAPAQTLTWLALEPLTGRTHQLRVHCAEMGWPIVGDDDLRQRRRAHGGPVLQLHAREIVVPLYKNREPIRVTAPVPPHMRERLARADGRARIPTRTSRCTRPASDTASVNRLFDRVRAPGGRARARPSCRRSIRR